MDLTREQIDNIAHMIGLGDSIKPYRNHYCSGENSIKSMDALCFKGLMISRRREIELGGWFYHLTEKGFQYVLDNRVDFYFDRRIKKLSTFMPYKETK